MAVSTAQQTKSKGEHRRTFCEISAWHNFDQNLQELVNDLHDTEAALLPPSLGGRIDSSYAAKATSQEEVRSPLFSFMAHSLNELAELTDCAGRLRGGGLRDSFCDGICYVAPSGQQQVRGCNVRLSRACPSQLSCVNNAEHLEGKPIHCSLSTMAEYFGSSQRIAHLPPWGGSACSWLVLLPLLCNEWHHTTCQLSELT